MYQPIIFIGMHRSGTSMLGRLLEELGLFVGVRKDENNEALFFQALNDWLLQQSGGSWDNPLATHYLWDLEAALPWTEKYIRNFLSSPRAIQFLGLRRYFSGGIEALNLPWGWKDPRNTFTLPMWLRIFPQAKVVCIERHGVDVAESLRARNMKEFARKLKKYETYRSLVFLRPMIGGFIDSPRCASLEGGFALWKEYVDQGRTVIRQLPEDRVLALRYEQMLEDPITYLRASARFCGLDTAESRLKALVADIKFDRAARYRSDPELRQFAFEHKAELSERGYD
jgi:hypothetical protein